MPGTPPTRRYASFWGSFTLFDQIDYTLNVCLSTLLPWCSNSKNEGLLASASKSNDIELMGSESFSQGPSLPPINTNGASMEPEIHHSHSVMSVETPIASPSVPILDGRVSLSNCYACSCVCCFYLLNTSLVLQRSKKPKPLTLLPLIALIFYDVSGGPFGIEVRLISLLLRFLYSKEKTQQKHRQAKR